MGKGRFISLCLELVFRLDFRHTLVLFTPIRLTSTFTVDTLLDLVYEDGNPPWSLSQFHGGPTNRGTCISSSSMFDKNFFSEV